MPLSLFNLMTLLLLSASASILKGAHPERSVLPPRRTVSVCPVADRGVVLTARHGAAGLVADESVLARRGPGTDLKRIVAEPVAQDDGRGTRRGIGNIERRGRKERSDADFAPVRHDDVRGG